MIIRLMRSQNSIDKTGQGWLATIFVSAIAIVFALVLQTAIAGSSPSTAGNSPMTTITVNSSNQASSWAIELASDNQSRATGLMHRKSMPPKTGMLFRFDLTRSVSMWMKNTFIPLDMVFLDQAGRITHIHEGAVPQSLDIISSNGPARFVLEINAGEARAVNLRPGDQFRHPWFLAIE